MCDHASLSSSTELTTDWTVEREPDRIGDIGEGKLPLTRRNDLLTGFSLKGKDLEANSTRLGSFYLFGSLLELGTEGVWHSCTAPT